MAATMTQTDRETTPARQRPTRAEVLRDLRKGAGRVANILAIVVTAAATIFAAILILNVVFVLFNATPTNGIVKHINSWAGSLAGPFKTLFSFHHKVKGHTVPNFKLDAVVNYGIAAVAYLLGGRLVASLLRRLAP